MADQVVGLKVELTAASIADSVPAHYLLIGEIYAYLAVDGGWRRGGRARPVPAFSVFAQVGIHR